MCSFRTKVVSIYCGRLQKQTKLVPSSRSLPSAKVDGMYLGISNSDVPRGQQVMSRGEQERILTVPNVNKSPVCQIFLFILQERLEIWIFARNILPPVNVGNDLIFFKKILSMPNKIWAWAIYTPKAISQHLGPSLHTLFTQSEVCCRLWHLTSKEGNMALGVLKL